MTWTKLGREFPSDTAIAKLSAIAVAVHVLGLCWSTDRELDGRITDAELAVCCLHLEGWEAGAKELVAKKWWKRVRGGYQVVHNLAQQPTNEDMTKERARWRESKRKARSANDSPADVPPGSREDPEVPSRAVPSRAVPSPAVPYRTASLLARLSDLYDKAAANEDVSREDFDELYDDYCRREKVLDPLVLLTSKIGKGEVALEIEQMQRRPGPVQEQQYPT